MKFALTLSIQLTAFFGTALIVCLVHDSAHLGRQACLWNHPIAAGAG